jgi:hypothetical protein
MVKQISVFLENKPGQLSEITKVLTAKDINIRALNIAEAAEYGIIRLVIKRHDEAVAALKEAGFVTMESEVVAVKIPDVPGGLNIVLSTVSDFDIQYMYTMIDRAGNSAFMVFRVDDVEGFKKIITSSGLNVVDEL